MTPSHLVFPLTPSTYHCPLTCLTKLKIFLNRLHSQLKLRLDLLNPHLFTVHRHLLTLSMLFLFSPPRVQPPPCRIRSCLTRYHHQFVFPEPPYVECVPPFVPMPQITLREPTYANCTSSSFMPPLHSTPPAKLSAEKIKAPLESFNYPDLPVIPPLHSDSPAKFSVETIMAPSTHFYPNHEEHAIIHADDPSSDHSAFIDLFSTPGPGYRTVPPVYFDSPTEDPSDSDPLEPAYELDSLDFRWEPFIQKGDNQKDVTSAPQSPPAAAAPAVICNSGDDYYYETRVEPEGEDDEDGQLYASINMGGTSAERCPSPSQSRFSFAPPTDDLPTTHSESHQQNQNAPATPQRSGPPFFAPVPGIFISPLRGDDPPNTPPNVMKSAPDGDNNPHSSQASNDTIEDWDDTTAD